jgi:inner membrane protein
VDNVTHAYVGAAIAECVTPNDATPRRRALFMGVGIVAANAPDIDLVYSGIIEEPLGYLLHHRGHSHTLPGLVALGLLIWAVLRLTPRTNHARRGTDRRWVLLLAAALASHLLMDTANGYGTHLLYPFSSEWVYGDAVFVLEPWLWVILGTMLALNAAPIWRGVITVLTLLLIGSLAYVGLLPPVLIGLVLTGAGAVAAGARAWGPKTRAAFALVATAVIFVTMAGVSRIAKGEATRAATLLGPGALVDIVADANPGAPWCWAVLTLQKGSRDAGGSLVARRGTLSLLPGLWPVSACASARLSAGRWSAPLPSDDSIVWHRVWAIDVDQLRALYARNCRVRAWLQFGRVPHVADGVIADLRFENPIGQNFTPMAVNSTHGCPAHPTRWEPPRRDVLGDAVDEPSSPMSSNRTGALWQ